MTAPQPGDPVPPLSRRVTKEVIRAYADASGDHNPLHLDDDFAAGTPFGGIIAHGMLLVSYVSQAMTGWLRDGWASGGGMSVAFLKPVRPGDEVTVAGTVESCEPAGEEHRVTCAFEVRNRQEEVVLAGKAWGRWLG